MLKLARESSPPFQLRRGMAEGWSRGFPFMWSRIGGAILCPGEADGVLHPHDIVNVESFPPCLQSEQSDGDLQVSQLDEGEWSDIEVCRP